MNGGADSAARRRVAIEMIAKHERTLRRTARRYSICVEDAEDAFQRSLEILLTKAPPGEARELIRWMQTVTKHEALAIRRSRERQLGSPLPPGEPEETVDWVALIPSGGAGPAERVERREEIARSREALQTLKPAELRALTLLAEGYSYAEIGEITGWSHTKINRSLAEGRERFRAFLSRSEVGGRCAELRPLLSAFGDGEASAEEAAIVREHLRACGHCRAAMRAYRAAPRAAGALVPLPLAARPLLDRVQEVLSGLQARLPGRSLRASVESAATQAAATGGTRGAGMAGLAKLLAICAGTAGGAAACVGAGVVPAPFDLVPEQRQATAPAPGSTPSAQGPSPVEQAPAVTVSDPARRTATQAALRDDAHRGNGRRRTRPGQRRGGRILAAPGPAALRAGRAHRSRAGGHRVRGGGVRPVRAWWAMGAAIAAFALLAERAEAAPGPPRNLEVLGGQGWQASTDFEVGWDNPAAAAGEPPLAAAHYALRDGRGSVLLGPKRTELPVERLGVGVPHLSGSYELEVWLEDRAGAQGPPAVTLLRFDDTRPGASGPLPHPRWIGRAELPFEVRIGHPEGPVPPAGIRGYAVSVDREPGAEPCAGPERCSEDETDLHGGIDDDLLSAGELPEGLSYVHAVAVSGSGMRSAVTGSIPLWVDRTDPVTRLSGLPEGWVNRAVVLRASATDSASGMRADGGDGPFTAISVDGGRPTVAAGATVSATVIGDGVHTVSYYARDAAGNVADGASVNGHRDPPPPQAPVRIDRDPPTVVFVPSAHPGEPELIEARVSDRLSGPDTQRGWIGVRAAGGGAPFEPLPTVSQGDRLRARWNSDGYPPGEYEFAALGRDRAGNPALGTRRAGGAPMVLPSPLKTETRLKAWLGGDRRWRTQAVRYGRGTTYAGRLSLASGSPLGGAPVRVVERFAAAAGLPPRTTILITGPDGRFALHLPPGPSREVLASFIGNAARGRAEAPRQELAVRSGLRLSSSAASAVVGGRPVVFRGRVAGEIPAGGLAVQLQFRLPGLPWTEFRTLETDRRGRFRYAYRFSDDDSRGVRFLFRAFVTAQGDWPYEPGGSLPVDVRGV